MKIIWSIKELVEVIKERQKNKFDVIIAVSGSRGNGKSTFLTKVFLRLGMFNPMKQQVYSRKDVIKLLESSTHGIIFDDEAIRTGYKRNFYEQDQKILIQMLNMYRDNFNIYGLCVPNFYSLDKDLRDLVKIHIHIIERGLAVFHLPNEERLYSDDIWDVKYNKKIEERWANWKLKKSNFSPPYYKLTTFRGYLEFGDLTPKQRQLYEEIKKMKRKEIYDSEIKNDDDQSKNFYDGLIKRLQEGKINKDTLLEICLSSGKKYSIVSSMLNTYMKDRGIDKTLKHFLLLGDNNKIHTNVKMQINSLVPAF